MKTAEQRAAHTAYMREWRAGNTDEQRQRNRENHRRWYIERRQERIAANRAWREANPEKAARVYRNNNRRRDLGRDNASVRYANIILADGCAYCGAPAEHVDHIEPKAHGGSSAWANLTGACAGCNLEKRDHPLLRFLLLREKESP